MSTDRMDKLAALVDRVDALQRGLDAYAHELGHAHASRHVAGRALVDAYGHWSNP